MARGKLSIQKCKCAFCNIGGIFDMCKRICSVYAIKKPEQKYFARTSPYNPSS